MDGRTGGWERARESAEWREGEGGREGEKKGEREGEGARERERERGRLNRVRRARFLDPYAETLEHVHVQVCKFTFGPYRGLYFPSFLSSALLSFIPSSPSSHLAPLALSPLRLLLHSLHFPPFPTQASHPKASKHAITCARTGAHRAR